MSTKKSLLETKDVIGQTIKLGDRVAYPKCGYGGYGAKVHTGTVQRITDCCVWILPDKEFKSDASHHQTAITNGEPYYIQDIRYGWKHNPAYKHLGWKKSLVYDWYMRFSHRVLKLS